ncbi:MAG TPA: hypothetical protein VK249_32770 [Anaerolineales bacterium]|nr:hypothetical protein [Anaerolineales bacterium]
MKIGETLAPGAHLPDLPSKSRAAPVLAHGVSMPGSAGERYIWLIPPLTCTGLPLLGAA